MKLVKCRNCATEKYVKDNIRVAICPMCIIQMGEIPYERGSYKAAKKNKNN